MTHTELKIKKEVSKWLRGQGFEWDADPLETAFFATPPGTVVSGWKRRVYAWVCPFAGIVDEKMITAPLPKSRMPVMEECHFGAGGHVCWLCVREAGESILSCAKSFSPGRSDPFTMVLGGDGIPAEGDAAFARVLASSPKK
jgi:hypothetical protein